ncbi:MAG: hypothetical protein AB7O59_01980 [Pirellulales bacterium]
MRGKFGLAVVALAAAVLVVSESESMAGRRHRGGCSSCGTSCATCTVPAAAPEAAPAEKAAAAPETTAPNSVAATADQQPAPSVSPAPQRTATYVSRRGLFRGRR